LEVNINKVAKQSAYRRLIKLLAKRIAQELQQSDQTASPTAQKSRTEIGKIQE